MNYTLFMAMVMIESCGDVNSIGDKGKAFGPAQIHQCVLSDVNRVFRIKKKRMDCLSLEESYQVLQLYIKIYRKKTWSERMEIMLLHHGPRGMKGVKKCDHCDRVMNLYSSLTKGKREEVH